MKTKQRFCRQCGVPLPEGATERRLYCSVRCRRIWQDGRRREERTEAREVREAERGWLQPDPWAAVQTEGEEARWLLAGIDPLPAGYAEEADALAGPLVAALPRERSAVRVHQVQPCGGTPDGRKQESGMVA